MVWTCGGALLHESVQRAGIVDASDVQPRIESTRLASPHYLTANTRPG